MSLANINVTMEVAVGSTNRNTNTQTSTFLLWLLPALLVLFISVMVALVWFIVRRLIKEKKGSNIKPQPSVESNVGTRQPETSREDDSLEREKFEGKLRVNGLERKRGSDITAVLSEDVRMLGDAILETANLSQTHGNHIGLVTSSKVKEVDHLGNTSFVFSEDLNDSMHFSDELLRRKHRENESVISIEWFRKRKDTNETNISTSMLAEGSSYSEDSFKPSKLKELQISDGTLSSRLHIEELNDGKRDCPSASSSKVWKMQEKTKTELLSKVKMKTENRFGNAVSPESSDLMPRQISKAGLDIKSSHSTRNEDALATEAKQRLERLLTTDASVSELRYAREELESCLNNLDNISREYYSLILKATKKLSDKTVENANDMLKEAICKRDPRLIKRALTEGKHALGTCINLSDSYSQYSVDPVELSSNLDKATELEEQFDEMEEMKQHVLKGLQGSITEMKRYSNTPPVLHRIMKATYIILGEEPASLLSWNAVLQLLEKTDKESLRSRISNMNIKDTSTERLLMAQKLINHSSLDDVDRISKSATFFYNWLLAVLQEVKQRQQSSHMISEVTRSTSRY